MGYALEVQLIERARALDLLTTPYVFSEENARDMARAGADIVVCHLGLTTGGAIGARTAVTLEGLRAPDRRLGGGRPRGEPGHPRAVPRRADRDPGRRRLHPGQVPGAVTDSTAPPAWSACPRKPP